MAVGERTAITEAELLRLGGQDQWFEVVNGELVAMTPVGFLHSIISGNVYRLLYAFVAEHKLGYVCMDSLVYVLMRSPEGKIIKSRIPDTSFVRKERLPKDFDLSRPFPGAPDLAIEVMSPDDSAEDLLAKIRDYQNAGTEQVWVLYPVQQELHQYIQSETDIHIYRGTDTIQAESLFPGLTIAVQDLFAMPAIE